MHHISVGQVHGQAVEVIRKNYGKILIAILVIMGIGFGVSMVSGLVSFPFIFGSTFEIMPLIQGLDMSSLDGILQYYGIIFQKFLPFYIGVMAFSILLSAALEPLQGGRRLYILNLAYGQKPKVEQMFKTYRRFWKFVGCYFWVWLWTFLWSLLLIVPGIIKSLSYSMTPYLVAQYENLTVREAMDLSKRITEGYKGQIFLMYLIIFGYSLVVSVTSMIFCLGSIVALAYPLLWLMPITFTLEATMYNSIKQAAFAKGVMSAEDLRIELNN